jgi:hypothetical protein
VRVRVEKVWAGAVALDDGDLDLVLAQRGAHAEPERELLRRLRDRDAVAAGLALVLLEHPLRDAEADARALDAAPRRALVVRAARARVLPRRAALRGQGAARADVQVELAPALVRVVHERAVALHAVRQDRQDLAVEERRAERRGRDAHAGRGDERERDRDRERRRERGGHREERGHARLRERRVVRRLAVRRPGERRGRQDGAPGARCAGLARRWLRRRRSILVELGHNGVVEDPARPVSALRPSPRTVLPTP